MTHLQGEGSDLEDDAHKEIEGLKAVTSVSMGVTAG